jgi:Fur family peroxide stress response transcriptional regulator
MGIGARERRDRLERFEELCREAGVPCTIQRSALLEAVLDREDHPTAHQVLEAVRARIRGISRATVHRNLETLVEMGVITKTCHPGGVIRYDARIDIHHHLVCLRCNSIADIDDENLDSLELPDTSAFGFKVSDFRVQLRGVCRECRRKDSKKRNRSK